jgi:hypothetical protein
MIVVFLPLVFPRPARGDDPADFAAERTGDRDFAPLDEPEDLIPDFVMAIRSTDEERSVENSFHICEVDSVNAQIAGALLVMPSERANPRDQSLDGSAFRHAKRPNQ